MHVAKIFVPKSFFTWDMAGGPGLVLNYLLRVVKARQNSYSFSDAVLLEGFFFLREKEELII